MKCSIDIRVRFNECDYYQHVNNSVLISYLDIAFAEFLRESRGSVRFTDVGVFLVHVSADYLNEATFDDELVVSTVVEKIGFSSMTCIQEIKNKNTDEYILKAKKIYVFIDPSTRKKCAVPQDIKDYVAK